MSRAKIYFHQVVPFLHFLISQEAYSTYPFRASFFPWFFQEPSEDYPLLLIFRCSRRCSIFPGEILAGKRLVGSDLFFLPAATLF